MSFTALEKIGILSLVVLGYATLNRLIWYLYRNFLGPRARKIDYKSLGKWAVITGGTDGLGKAYARALASKGCDIMLISRTESKLQEVAAEIERDFKVKTQYVVVDFTQGPEIYSVIEKQLTGLDIGVLVNNVGLSYPYPERFLQLPDKEKLIEDLINTNIVSLTKMCAIVMPGMVDKKKGLVINLSSAMAIMPSPLFVVYAASKAYVDKFTEDLASSYEPKGLIIQSVLPGPVATKMLKASRPTWMAPLADKFVESALSTCGKQRHTTGYRPHDLLVGTIGLIESICPAAAVWLITRTSENIRLRALKKMKATIS